MNFVLTGRGNFVEVQGTAESKPFTEVQMNEMTALARVGHNELFKVQERIIGEFYKRPTSGTGQ